MSTPWCVIDEKLDLICERCGQRHATVQPGERGVAVTKLGKLTKAFMELHKDCKEKPAPDAR
jgi:hypothetical protein